MKLKQSAARDRVDCQARRALLASGMPGDTATPARAWYHPPRLLRRVLLYLIIIYLAVCLLLYVKQASLIYIGAGAMSQDAALAYAEQANLMPWKLGDTTVGFVRKDFADPAPRGTIVLCHGNGEQACEDGDMAEQLRQRGFRTLLYEYPGYSGRPGPPSERVIVPELRAIVRALDAQGLGPLYLWGQSLGSGVAAAACADATLPVHGLILIWPYDSLPAVGQMHYPIIPVTWLMTDQYNSAANLASFAHPVFVARAENDTVVPPARSLNLFAQLPEPKKMIVFQGLEHSEFPADSQWWDEALDFVAPR